MWKKVHVNVTVTAVLSILVWITHLKQSLKNAISDNVLYWWIVVNDFAYPWNCNSL